LLQERRDGKRESVEEVNLEPLEARGGDPTNKCFQVSTKTSKPEKAKARKCDQYHGSRMHELLLHSTVGDSKVKGDHESLQLRRE
jgi:hypothetical protein